MPVLQAAPSTEAPPTAPASSRPLTFPVTLAALTLGLLGTIAYRVLDAPYWEFNAQRLLPSLMLARGLTLFPEPRGGVLLSTMYGPVTALTYLPATLAHTPVAAVLIGSALTALLSFAAIFLLHFRQTPRRPSLVLLAFLTTAFLVCLIDSTQYACLRVHADGPALFYAMIAVTSTSLRTRRPYVGMALSALFSALAVWAKQPLVGVALGLGLYYLIAEGPRAFARFSVYAASVTALMGAAFSLMWGWRSIAINLLDIPSHHPWKHPSKLVELFYSYRTFARDDLALILPIAAYILFHATTRRPSLAALRAAVRGQLWIASLLVGLCLIPLSLISYSKVGGDTNNLSFCTLFLLLALTLLLQKLATEPDPHFARFVKSLLLVAAIACATIEAPLAAAIPGRLRGLANTDQNVAFNYIRQHPGQGYFPWFPTAQLLADDNIYNGVYGLWNHAAGGYPPTDAAFRAHVPANAHFVAFAPGGSPWVNNTNFLWHLPEYTCATTDPALPGFKLYYSRPAAHSLNIPCILNPPPDPDLPVN